MTTKSLKKSAKQSIHILGPGAMGLLWASHLAKNDWDVTLLHQQQPATKTATIVLQTSSGLSRYSVKQQAATAAITKLKVLLVTVKANQLKKAIKPLLPKINQNTLLILSQNGVGSETELYQSFPKLRSNQVLQIVTSHAALRHSQTHVQQTGFGFCWIGYSPKFQTHKSQQLPKPQSHILHALLNLEMINGWSNNLEGLIWQKLIINASINPLAAILYCSNGELLSKSLLPLLKEIVSESCSIARQAGFNDFKTAVMFEKVKQVCRDTATNKNSMLVDIINHRPTEIAYINQVLLDTANKLSLDAPWNLCLTSILNTINHVKMRKYKVKN
jgi:2-dehydropantoate 2-reductase